MQIISSGLLGTLLLVACSGGPEFERATAKSELRARDPGPRQADALLVARGPVTAWEVEVRDGEDGQATTINDLVVRVRSTLEARDWEWELQTSLGTLAGTVTGDAGDQRIRFAGAGLRIADGAELSCTLTIAGDPGAKATDNATFQLEIWGQDQLLADGSTPFAPTARADNGAGLRYAVTATELRVIEQPPASLIVGEPFALAVAFTDAAGHVDADIDGDEVRAIRGDTALELGTTVTADGVARFRDERSLVLEDAPSKSLTLQVEDGAGGVLDLSAAPASTTTLSLSPDNDADASLQASDALPEPTEVNLAEALNGPVEVLDFTIADGGGGDGFSCSVDALEFVVSGTVLNEAHRFTLIGPDLMVPAVGELRVDGGFSVVSFNSLQLEVLDAGLSTYTLSVELADDLVEPGDTLLVSLDYASVQAWGTSVTSGSVSNAPGLVFKADGPLLGVTPSAPTALVGGQTAVVVEDTCAEDEVVMGYRVTTHYQGAPFVSSVQTLCAELVVPTIGSGPAEVWPRDALALRGREGQMSVDFSCPLDHVVVGVHGSSGSAVDSFGVDCAPVMLSGDMSTIGRGESAATPAQGGPGGSKFSLSCENGGVARGTATRVLDANVGFGYVSLEAFGLLCGNVVAE